MGTTNRFDRQRSSGEHRARALRIWTTRTETGISTGTTYTYNSIGKAAAIAVKRRRRWRRTHGISSGSSRAADGTDECGQVARDPKCKIQSFTTIAWANSGSKSYEKEESSQDAGGH